MSAAHPSRVLAKEARDALTAVHGRLQLLHRTIDRGEVDCAALLIELDVACLAIRRVAALVDALECAVLGGSLSLAADPPAPPRHPDD